MLSLLLVTGKSVSHYFQLHLYCHLCCGDDCQGKMPFHYPLLPLTLLSFALWFLILVLELESDLISSPRELS